MRRRGKVAVFVMLIGVALSLYWPPPSALAKAEILSGTVLEPDHKPVIEGPAVAEHAVVKGILTAFKRAEEALQARDIDALMAIYSKGYNYHGLRKSDMRKIWGELFTHYRQISTTHLFTTIRTVESGSDLTAEIARTGALWATVGATGQRVTIDSWYGEVHHLVNEDGMWRLRGSVGEAPTVLPFGTAPHPLF